MGWPHYRDYLGDCDKRPIVAPIPESSETKHLRLVLLVHVGSGRSWDEKRVVGAIRAFAPCAVELFRAWQVLLTKSKWSSLTIYYPRPYTSQPVYNAPQKLFVRGGMGL
ncbi:hypothetical protein N7466_001520 [Penicillium verhagenii]|uniref:uncharacterized protein n=1 Tax=Penicillium verhagenii TaxID=1562060 RepID=UPI002545A04E|nr:uncharacterized protein N7466_001520 [Penicillium verhagenii]KAJ5938386.1 hypothetical protein N7466_001520 [Penicillium verhagenii]